MPKIIVLAENHLDPIARRLCLNNLLFLVKSGYTQFGFEHDHDKSIDFEIESIKHQVTMDSLMLQAIANGYRATSSERAQFMFAPNNQILLKLFSEMKRLKMHYQGLDIILGDRFEHNRDEIVAKVKDKKNERDKCIANYLLKMQSQGNGITIIGADHMRAVQQHIIDAMGLAAAENAFQFIVPFTGSYKEDTSIRQHMIELIEAEKYKELQARYCPLFTTFFSGYPEDTIDSRFKEMIPHLPPAQPKKSDAFFYSMMLFSAGLGLATGGVAGAAIGAALGSCAGSEAAVDAVRLCCNRKRSNA